MPELPEVETVAHTLRSGAHPLVGRTINSTDVLWPREVSGLTPEAFMAGLRGRQVTQVGRHGKYLMLYLSPQRSAGPILFVHLRMSGRLAVARQTDAPSKHSRVIWRLDKNLELRFDDARKFGRVYLPNNPQTVLDRVGPDALTADAGDFVARLLAKRGALKPILLDQKFLAGIGNIYADESLHRAKLHPQTSADQLTATQAHVLFGKIQDVLREGIAANGASFDWVYPGGNFQTAFQVYGQTGEPCRSCGQPIQRILVGQRGTHFCLNCQPAASKIKVIK